MKVSRIPTTLVMFICAALTIICTVLLFNKEGDSSEGEEKQLEQITCQLDDSALKQRISVFSQWLLLKEEVIELEDGYSLRFPGNDEWTERVIEFIKSERLCCSFIKFKLTFEPNNGPIWLFMGGSTEIKKFVDTMIK